MFFGWNPENSWFVDWGLTVDSMNAKHIGLHISHTSVVQYKIEVLRTSICHAVNCGFVEEGLHSWQNGHPCNAKPSWENHLLLAFLNRLILGVAWKSGNAFILAWCPHLNANFKKDQTITLPETNIAPENRPLEKEIPIGLLETTIFMGYVSFREGKPMTRHFSPKKGPSHKQMYSFRTSRPANCACNTRWAQSP